MKSFRHVLDIHVRMWNGQWMDKTGQRWNLGCQCQALHASHPPTPASLSPGGAGRQQPKGKGGSGEEGPHLMSLISRLLSAFPAQHEELSEYRPILSEAHQLQRRTSVANKKLVLIPLIFICLRVWSTVRFVLTLCGSPAVRMPVLVVLHVGLPSPAWPAAGSVGQAGPNALASVGMWGTCSPVPSSMPCLIGSLEEKRLKVSVAPGQPVGVELLSHGLGGTPGKWTDP